MNTDKNKEKNRNIHTDHRKRMRERYLKNGADSFADHEFVELLLFHSMPRKNLNEQAHRLLEAFDNSFAKILDAPIGELIKVDGIGENTALFIRLISECARKYNMAYMDDYAFDDPLEKYKARLVAWYTNITTEVVLLMCIGNRGNMLSLDIIHEGSVNSAYVSKRKIVDLIIKNNASGVVLAHNHPGGIAVPSSEDRATTHNLRAYLGELYIDFIEHYVVSGSMINGIMNNTKGAKNEGRPEI